MMNKNSEQEPNLWDDYTRGLASDVAKSHTPLGRLRNTFARLFDLSRVMMIFFVGMIGGITLLFVVLGVFQYDYMEVFIISLFGGMALLQSQIFFKHRRDHLLFRRALLVLGVWFCLIIIGGYLIGSLLAQPIPLSGQ